MELAINRSTYSFKQKTTGCGTIHQERFSELGGRVWSAHISTYEQFLDAVEKKDSPGLFTFSGMFGEFYQVQID